MTLCPNCHAPTETTFRSETGTEYRLRLIRPGDLVRPDAKRPWGQDYLAAALYRGDEFHALIDFGLVRDGMLHVPATNTNRGIYSPEKIDAATTERLREWALPHQVHAYNSRMAHEILGRPLEAAE